MLIRERIKNIATVTQHGCCIIKQMAHNGVMTWVIMPDAVNILQERTIAITSYRNTQSTRSPTADWSKARGLSTSQQDKLTPGANGCNWTEAHGVIAPSATALILYQKYYRLCSVQSCSLFLTVIDWGIPICFLQMWVTESDPTLTSTDF